MNLLQIDSKQQNKNLAESAVFSILIMYITLIDMKPKYILLNRTPGVQWDQNDPSTITPNLLKDVTKTLNISNATTNPNLYIGQEFVFSLFETQKDTLLESMQALLNASLITNIPISVELDGENWWDESNLWNFFDKNSSNYKRTNIYNVERYGWDLSTAVQIGWRNWGSQIRVLPQQNILSDEILSQYIPLLTQIVKCIDDWYTNTLIPANKENLLSVVKIGWEAGVEYNAYYYTNGNSYRLRFV